MYWMHLEVSTGATLADLDHFLRKSWLECYGHLSAFEIGNQSYPLRSVRKTCRGSLHGV
ncbi:hypothetical protein ccbrp13_31200 [Ktedonobacteria bacterium brp13]|nr:hypothetical protein ccbrp13_31200 [Ktedonobacteria bacterium brp13]